MDFSLLVLVVTTCCAGLTLARPSENNHRGLYDGWKPVPFVDNPKDTGSMFGEYASNNIANTDTTNTLTDKYEKLYKSYNKAHDRLIGDGNSKKVKYSDTTDDNHSQETDNIRKVADNGDGKAVEGEEKKPKEMKEIKPLEGGVEDMTENRQPEPFPMPNDKATDGGKVKTGRKHRKNRHKKKRGREGRKSHKSVKKDLSEKEKKRKSRKEKKGKKKVKATVDKVTEEEDELGFNMKKFDSEHPDFQKNVGTIVSDEVEDMDKSEKEQPVKNVEVKNAEEKKVEVKNVEAKYDDVKNADVKNDINAEVTNEFSNVEVKEAEVENAEVKEAELKEGEVENVEIKNEEYKKAEVVEDVVKEVIVDTSDSVDDHGMKDVYDVDDDDDDAGSDLNVAESESNDLSSEEFNDYYDYYDEAGDSSYSSSEQLAEQQMLKQSPYDWLKDFDKMQGDQPMIDDSQFEHTETTTITKKKYYSYSLKDNQFFTDKQPVTDDNSETQEESFTSEKDDIIPKTYVEPSTSPNPPTSKKDAGSTVTQPAYPQWKQRVETWNLIESKPIESCTSDADCPAGRMCKYSLCLCGQPDFCEGHSKPVCGSDGRRYPSHCELHRSACVLGVHIHVDAAGDCLQNDDDTAASKESSTGNAVETVDERPAEKVSSDATTQLATDENIKLQTSKPESSRPVDILINQDDDQESEADSTSSNESDDSDSADTENNKSDNIKLGTNDDDDAVKSSVLVKVIKTVLEEENKQANSAFAVNGTEVEDTESTNDDDEVIETDSMDSQSESMESYGSDDQDSQADSSEEVDGVTKDDSDSSEEFYDDEDDYDYSEEYEDDQSYEDDSLDSDETDSLVPLYCTPDIYMKFKADVLEYFCLFFDEPHCNMQTQEEKQRLATIMFNYFDKNYSGYIEREELWEMHLTERMDKLSSLCTLVDIALFDELGKRDRKLSIDEFIQAFDIPDMQEHEIEVVPLLASVGNGLEIKCDVTDSQDVVWTRNSVDLSLIDFPGISVLADGSLYLDTVGFHMVGNLTCHDRKKPGVIQIHMLTVQKAPHVSIYIPSSDCYHGNDLVIKCHVEGYPRPSVSWQFDDTDIENGPKYHIHNYDDTLTVYSTDYSQDTGVYKCQATNMAGTGEATIAVTVHNPNDTDNTVGTAEEESFIIFHDNGYTMHEPNECLTQRHVRPEFSNFYFIPDELDAPPALCQPDIPCVWGDSINVNDEFIYVTQPRENRIVVIDVKNTFNPNQVIFTDHMPVSVHYIQHLDEVWVLCWNGEEDGGSKTVVIIRDASKKTQHHSIHTQPIGNRFDLVQNIFLPSSSDLHHPYRYGYTVHNGQKGLFKVDLKQKKYIKAVDLTKYNCVPTNVVFVPLGGHTLVQCDTQTLTGKITQFLTLDYITDMVLSNVTTAAVPYVSPDNSHVAMVDEQTGKIDVHTVTQSGEIIHEFDVTIGSPVGKATFHKANYNHGYDMYMTLKSRPVVFSVSLSNGKIDAISDIAEFEYTPHLPWYGKERLLVSGGPFSDFLVTTGTSSVMVLHGKQQKIQCDYRDHENTASVTYALLNRS